MSDNIFTTFLRQLGVKYTGSFSRRYFNEHPHKYNLFGLSAMLSEYGIKNAGIKISDKSEIHSIVPPFIAHTGDDFAIVEKIEKNDVRFIERSKRISIPLEEFLEMWTGYALIAEPDKTSKEPDYNAHSREELFHKLRKVIISFVLVFLAVFAFFSNGIHVHPGVILLLIISLAGVYIGYLLVLKQLRIQSDYADKLCSLFKYADCNNILESDAAKLLGVIGWSEIGLGYFISNVMIISFLPSLLPSMLLVNLFCLPYSFWSIWYQRFKARQWCPLCLMVMFLLWGIFMVGLLFGLLSLPLVTFWGIMITGSIYTISILTINMLIPVIARGSRMENIQYEINSIKADEDVFNTKLRKQPRYEVSKETSRVLLGNLDSNLLVTIFSNPHCNPCSRMHERINKLLEQNNHICVQYIFSSLKGYTDCTGEWI